MHFSDFFCKNFGISISSTTNASHCNNYKLTKNALEKQNRTAKIKCSECNELNFGWCKSKRKAIEEPFKTRSCVKFRIKQIKNKKPTGNILEKRGNKN